MTALLANSVAQPETLLHSLEWVAAGLHVNSHKTEYMCFNHTGDIPTLNSSSRKLVNWFNLLRKQCLINRERHQQATSKEWTAIDRLSVIWKSDLTDKIKRCFLKAAVVSILLYGCTLWKLTKRTEKKLDGNYTRMLQAILKKSWRQHCTKQQLHGLLPPITKNIQIRRTRHAGHSGRSSDDLISDVLLWTPSHGRIKAGRPARIYIQQFCADTGCCPEDQPKAMDDREEWGMRFGVSALMARHDDDDDDLGLITRHV